VVLGDQPELHLLFQFTTDLDFQSEVVTFLFFLFTSLNRSLAASREVPSYILL
jgi:hypothetical protein